MDAVLRGLAVYLFLLVVVRLTGRRTLGELTAFDFVLLLIIGEATQQALLGEDFSITNAALLILTLLGADVAISLLKQRWGLLERWVDGVPMVLVRDGEPIRERLDRSRVDESDILAAARELRGLERMEQIKYAVLEANGAISIIPRDADRGAG